MGACVFFARQLPRADVSIGHIHTQQKLTEKYSSPIGFCRCCTVCSSQYDYSAADTCCHLGIWQTDKMLWYRWQGWCDRLRICKRFSLTKQLIQQNMIRFCHDLPGSCYFVTSSTHPWSNLHQACHDIWNGAHGAIAPDELMMANELTPSMVGNGRVTVWCSLVG